MAMKTRLTTIKGYAQLLERELDRTHPRPERIEARLAELNHEIERLVALIERIEQTRILNDGLNRNGHVEHDE